MSARGGATTVAPPSELEEPRFAAVKTAADAQVRQGGGAASGPPRERGAVGRGATARQGCWVPARCCDGSPPVAEIRSPTGSNEFDQYELFLAAIKEIFDIENEPKTSASFEKPQRFYNDASNDDQVMFA